MINATLLELEAQDRLKELDHELKKIKDKYTNTKKTLRPVFFTSLLGIPLGIGYLLFKNKNHSKSSSKNYPTEDKKSPKKDYTLLTSILGSEILTILASQLITSFLKNKS